ncbi:Glutamyl-tRNA(Gln) amidotransferase subunit C [Arcobacter porcinus]|uniref:Aspartyl/glutamyl-tRNA(Asn/Gln) amidotransferase subunit C n=1 Tax=Arcobacter porcinus TaxID=1935204 RepID=A0ABX2YB08_9BACT|nr:Asp-tRNA(Asn)/Glu-tRNA(Gln) amidotransferase subunit GatC [Arcobacter porcinus]OCL84027.1 Glutamyl-tRNA(Gln) amidotransferase subunit C [Arcobacter porcinus]OCL84549.1 Glutamyl-tRNA(Gln) amidotransferase subunit C [Arcobacter porcinus]OCL89091.1 Glutamyl-tRNA(Gln) amidotransferase subunit C [Arcobacter porcinus]OCL91511.1 Glutamyl-tRNA(Gln) amidotransferase subunit C [Arcobacter porcinus]
MSNIVVDDKLIAKLEKLSSLKIEDENKDKIKKDISQMLEFINNLNEVDVSGVEAYVNPISGGTLLRDDIAISSKEISDSILKNAPKSEDNHFVVPKIIE